MRTLKQAAFAAAVGVAVKIALFLVDLRTGRDIRPQAQIEVETSLGAVIGAHAGPGTLALFWFSDD